VVVMVAFSEVGFDKSNYNSSSVPSLSSSFGEIKSATARSNRSPHLFFLTNRLSWLVFPTKHQE
jgi:hypothetical protein